MAKATRYSLLYGVLIGLGGLGLFAQLAGEAGQASIVPTFAQPSYSDCDGAEYRSSDSAPRPQFHARLRLSSHAFQAGMVVRLQVANLGAGTVSYGEGIEVDLFDGHAWVLATMSPPRRVERRAIRLAAGEVGPCEKLRIPADTPAGLYRLEKRVFAFEGQGKKKVRAVFEVTS